MMLFIRRLESFHSFFFLSFCLPFLQSDKEISCKEEICCCHLILWSSSCNIVCTRFFVRQILHRIITNRLKISLKATWEIIKKSIRCLSYEESYRINPTISDRRNDCLKRFNLKKQKIRASFVLLKRNHKQRNKRLIYVALTRNVTKLTTPS